MGYMLESLSFPLSPIAGLRKTDIQILEKVKLRVQAFCNKIEEKPSGTLISEKWKSKRGSLRNTLEKSSWKKLLAYFSKPENLSGEQAQRLRAAHTCAHFKRDYRDRFMCCMSEYDRIAYNKYREDGFVLPFGHSSSEFTEPNPTLFHTADHWPKIPDDADPLTGWPIDEIYQTSSGPAREDIYGKLFFYLRQQLRLFLDGLSGSARVSFKLLYLDIVDLPGHVDRDSFSRIHIPTEIPQFSTNPDNLGWLDLDQTLEITALLLQPVRKNRHATIITLFSDVVDEYITPEDKIRDMAPSSHVMREITKYLPQPSSESSSEVDRVRMRAGMRLVRGYEDIFNRYLDEKIDLAEINRVLKLMPKQRHTIIDKWPYRLKLRPSQNLIGAQDEFAKSLRGGVSSRQRYIEWKRVEL